MRTSLLTLFVLLLISILPACTKKQVVFKDPGEIKWKSKSPAVVKKEITPVNDQHLTASNENGFDAKKDFQENENFSPDKNLLNKYKKEVDLIETVVKSEKEGNNNEPVKITRKEKRKLRKDIKEAVNSNDTKINTLLLVIIAIFLPPVAVALVRGITGAFWLNLVLTLLFYVPGLIHALYIIFSRK